MLFLRVIAWYGAEKFSLKKKLFLSLHQEVICRLLVQDHFWLSTFHITQRKSIIKRVMQCAPEKVNGEDGLPIPPYRVYNIGNNSPENLLDFVDILQQELIRAGVLPEDYDFEAHKKLVPMQPGDVPVTYADTSALERDFGFKPSTSLREGLRRFAEWYKEFYL